MAPTYDVIKAHMVPYEGNVRHMYLDTVGKVTVGIGNMLPNVAAAQALKFINRTTKNQATADEIKAGFDTVSGKPKGMHNSKYREFTTLDLPDTEIDTLFRARISQFQASLAGIYSSYSDYPDSAQLALLDLIFNLGPSGLKNEWPKLNKAIGAEDWAEAAKNCNRPQVQAARNAAVQGLFEKAVEDANAKKSGP